MKFASTTLVFVVSALLALGLVMLYSATMFHRGGPFWGSLVVNISPGKLMVIKNAV